MLNIQMDSLLWKNIKKFFKNKIKIKKNEWS